MAIIEAKENKYAPRTKWQDGTATRRDFIRSSAISYQAVLNQTSPAEHKRTRGPKKRATSEFDRRRERQGDSRRSSKVDVDPAKPMASALSLTRNTTESNGHSTGKTLASVWQRLSNDFEVLLDTPADAGRIRQSTTDALFTALIYKFGDIVDAGCRTYGHKKTVSQHKGNGFDK